MKKEELKIGMKFSDGDTIVEITNIAKSVVKYNSYDVITNEFLGNNKGVLCKTFRINISELLANSEFGVTEQGLCLPIGYHENYDEVKNVYSIGYESTIKCVITPNDKIFISEI